MTTGKAKRGFTIVEMMVAMVAFAIMAMAVGSMLYFSWTGWRRNTQSVNMQRDAVLAMDRIAREIRNSNITEISYDADGIYFSLGIVRTNAVNILASDIPVMPGVNISGFGVEINSNAVTVGFTLSTDDNADQNDYQMTVNTRN